MQEIGGTGRSVFGILLVLKIYSQLTMMKKVKQSCNGDVDVGSTIFVVKTHTAANQLTVSRRLSIYTHIVPFYYLVHFLHKPLMKNLATSSGESRPFNTSNNSFTCLLSNLAFVLEASKQPNHGS